MRQAVLVYDSTCLLCSKSVQLLLKYDTNIHFLFSSFQSDFSKKHTLSPTSVVVITPKQEILQHHHAVRYVISHLPKLRWLRLFFVITPLFLQRTMYSCIAKYRKHWFGSHTCLIFQQFNDRFI